MENEIRDMHVKNALYRMILSLSGETFESLPYEEEVIDHLYQWVVKDLSSFHLSIFDDFTEDDIDAPVEYVGLYEDGIRNIEDRCMSRNDLIDEAVNEFIGRLTNSEVQWNSALFCNLEDDFETATAALQKVNIDENISFCHPWYDDDNVLCAKNVQGDVYPCGRSECLCRKNKHSAYA